MNTPAAGVDVARLRQAPWQSAVLAAIAAAAASGVALLAALASSYEVVLAVGAFAVLCTWLFVSDHYQYALLALMVYVGVADGFIRLKTGLADLTIIRDVLLYSIVAGVLVRQLIRGRASRLPPMTGWILAFVGVVLVQVANPAGGTVPHSLAAVRQHLEWVPLFFLGFVAMRTQARLRTFLLLLTLIAAINGAVGYVQFQLSPDQLASWGPGYESLVIGTDDVSSRTFRDSSGELRNRPPALGADMGFGGILGVLAAPAVLALVPTLRRSAAAGAVAVLLAGGVLTAIATSQARASVIGALLAVLAFITLSALARRSLVTLASVGVVLAIGVLVVSFLTRGVDRGAFERYERISLSPSALVSETYDYRRGTFELLPGYAARFPLGAGLGTAGPAATYPGGGENVGRALASETQPSYVLIELGIPGVIVFFGFGFMLLFRAVTRVPGLPDRDTRLLLTAITAGLLATFGLGAVGSITAPPLAPFFWFAAGILAYWVGRPAAGDRSRRRARPAALGRAGAMGPSRPATPSRGPDPGAAEVPTPAPPEAPRATDRPMRRGLQAARESARRAVGRGWERVSSVRSRRRPG